MIPTNTNAERFRRSLRETSRFVYGHSTWLVVISVCWVLASLPVVTAGLATLGAYAAIRSLRNDDRPRWSAVSTSLHRDGLNVTLMSFVPVLLAFVTGLYAFRYVETSSTEYLLFTIAGVYLVSFLLLVLLTAVARLSDGEAFVEAVTGSYAWVVRDPIRSALLVSTTGVVVLVGIVSIVGLVVIVPGVLFSLHLEVLDGSSASVAAKGVRDVETNRVMSGVRDNNQ